MEGLPVVAQEHRLGLVEPVHVARGRRAESSAFDALRGKPWPLGFGEPTQRKKIFTGVGAGWQPCPPAPFPKHLLHAYYNRYLQGLQIVSLNPLLFRHLGKG